MNKNKILRECIVIFNKHLQASLKESMRLSLRKLFSKAKVAGSNQEEQVLFNQYRQLKEGAKNFSEQISKKIKSMPDFISSEINKSDSKMSLSLVADEELSISLALTQLDSTLEVVSHAELYMLEKRMNVIYGNEKIDKTNMPFSPASIVWLFSHGFDAVSFDVQVKTMIIEFLIKEFGEHINEAYHLINAIFVREGVLPNIKPEVIKPKHKSSERPAENTTQQSSSKQSQFNQAGRQDQTSGDAAQSQQTANQQQDYSSSGYFDSQRGDSPPATQQTGKQHAAKDEQNEQSVGGNYQRKFDPETKQLVDSIFKMLSPSDGAGVGDNQGSNHNNQNIKDNDFDQALAQISQESGVVANSKNIHTLKELLADQVRNNTGNYYPELSAKQNKVLDLMGMVYDEIEKDQSIDSHIRSSFNAINVPLLRTAINDESFFVDSGHPARKFMELLVDSSQRWHGTEIIKQIHQYSDTAAKSFDGSSTSFDKALAELSEYLKVTKSRAVKAEEKWVSAAQGKEKMDVTKAIVEAKLKEVMQGCDIKFIQDIIQHVWRDSLTLTLLREGQDSEQWNKKVKSVMTIAKMGNKKEFMNLRGPEKIAAMHHLDQTMDELGFSKRDRISTKDNIFTCLDWQEQATDEDLSSKSNELKKVLSIDEAVKTAELESTNKKIEEIRELNDEEIAMKQEVVNFPYGTLFDFKVNQQNDVLRRKLSWVSTVSEKVLFVDLIGRHPHKMKLSRLAIDLCRKNIVRVELPKGGYFKTALSKIMNRLKKMAA